MATAGSSLIGLSFGGERRIGLQFISATAGALFLGAAARPGKMLSELGKMLMEAGLETPIEKLINKEFGLLPEQVKVTILPGTHSFNNAVLSEVEILGDYSIVTGEIRAANVAADLSRQAPFQDDSTRSACLAPGEGSPADDLNETFINLQRRVKDGKPVVIADADDYALDDVRHASYRSYVIGGGLGVGVVTAGAGLIVLRQKLMELGLTRNDKLTAGTFLKLTPVLIPLSFVAAFTASHLVNLAKCFQSSPRGTDEFKFGRDRGVEESFATEVNFEQWLNWLSPPPVVGYYEGTVNWRNQIMSNNLFRTISQSVGVGETGINILDFHGNAHGEIEDRLFEGVDANQRAVQEMVAKLLAYGELLIQSAASPQEWIDGVNRVIDYGYLFSETINVGGGPVLTLRDLASQRQVLSARALMVEGIKEIITSGRNGINDLDKQRSKFWSQVSATLLVKQLDDEELLLETEADLQKRSRVKTRFNLDFDSEATWLHLDDFIINVDEITYHPLTPDSICTSKGKSMIVGFMAVDGRCCPITREVIRNHGEIFVVDTVSLGRDQEIVSPPRKLKEIDIAELPQETITFLKMKGDEAVLEGFEMRQDGPSAISGKAYIPETFDPAGFEAIVIESK